MTQLPAVLVTGGSRGIGAAICRLLATKGYAVAVNYASRADAAEAIVAEIKAAGGQAVAVGGDVADPAAVAAMFVAAEAALGPIGGLVNNAGLIGANAKLENQPQADIERLFAVNVYGTIYCAQEAVRRMSKAHGGAGGSIVNVSSVAARLGGLSGVVPYAATKGAVESLTKGLANEVARDGIRVNAVAPGMTATDMTTIEMREQAQKTGIPMARVGEAEEIAEAVLWLISPASSYVTGTVVTVSGGR
ncbi:SDR family oxidoreductase [Acidisoma cellulosilytica]|uniref:SDR family oxidoreductase n=1 Tax=Acidisoma cellulosilyticum TaxID=2802395 RepID=A0A964E289_9PROT|nr:SDR family oxidoreductase [Acidisoma cellulosilyticum]MCB8879166.1 SDR family oxidoreductase [Acidisoma cellulosilyticum]